MVLTQTLRAREYRTPGANLLCMYQLLFEFGVNETNAIISNDGDIDFIAHCPNYDLMVQRQVIHVVTQLLPHFSDHYIAFREINFRPNCIDLVIDGGYCGIEETTVISLLDEVPEIIRPGAGSLEPFA